MSLTKTFLIKYPIPCPICKSKLILLPQDSCGWKKIVCPTGLEHYFIYFDNYNDFFIGDAIKFNISHQKNCKITRWFDKRIFITLQGDESIAIEDYGFFDYLSYSTLLNQVKIFLTFR